MKYKLLLLLIIITAVSAQDSCLRPYNRIGNICCPDYDNDLSCDIATTTTRPNILIVNETHIIDSRTGTITEADEKIIDLSINSSLNQNNPTITIRPPKVTTITSTTTTSTIVTATTLNIKTVSKQTINTQKQYTTTTKEYKSANRVTPLEPKDVNIFDTYKYYIGGGVVAIIIILILFLYFLGDEEE